MKYKVGDRVRIKNLDWYNENKDDNREIKFENGIFTILKSTFLGQIMTIEEITPEKQYILMEDKYKTLWTDEMIEGLVEEETSQNAKLVSERFSEYVNPSEFKYAQNTITKMLLQGANIPNDYILKDENGNVINATQIVLEKKKKEYPKTYEECCEVLGIPKDSMVVIYCREKEDYEVSLSRKLRSMQKLLICRDAYWKIAGEEMGLGKPWEPDWKNHNIKYILYNQEGEIDSINVSGPRNYILAFPTEEMRDAFYENFKSEIEICKELL